jgi:hypothetical protein
VQALLASQAKPDRHHCSLFYHFDAELWNDAVTKKSRLGGKPPRTPKPRATRVKEKKGKRAKGKDLHPGKTKTDVEVTVVGGVVATIRRARVGR